MSDPFKVTEPTVISFSGGRTSAYLLWRVMQANGGMPEEAIAVFANTGKEEEATLEFVRDCEANWGVEIHWLEYRGRRSKVSGGCTLRQPAGRVSPLKMLIVKSKYLPNPGGPVSAPLN
jgi:3'-phosphoadenosine 5'-phosphosulfate sulfotransferase (PAPS reductase)/FAD synthetase